MRITMHIDKKLWDDMRNTMGTISMPLVAHQQVQQLLNQVEQSANQGQSQRGPSHTRRLAMSLLIFILVVLVVICLIMWAIWMIPFPPTPFPIKEILMVLVLIIAIIIIVQKAGWAAVPAMLPVAWLL
jgi:ABC-type multidrug transport system fused ATPase/permease subunit